MMMLFKFLASFPLPRGRWMPCHEFLRSLRIFESETGGRRGDVRSSAAFGWPSRETMRSILALAMIFATMAEMRVIVSWSMYPTFHKLDRVVVEKVTYYIRSPAINDIVLFRLPKNLQGMRDKNDVFIKRIVARAGDVVEIKDGMLFVNGSVQREEFLTEPPSYRISAIVSFCYLTLNGFLPSIFKILFRQQYVFLNNIWSSCSWGKFQSLSTYMRDFYKLIAGRERNGPG